MEKKAIVVLFEHLLAKTTRSSAELAADLGLNEEEYDLVVKGAMEISPALAIKIEQVFGVEAIGVLNAQSEDQLVTLGQARKKRVTTSVKQAEPAAAEQPVRRSAAQSPMRNDTDFGAFVL